MNVLRVFSLVCTTIVFFVAFFKLKRISARECKKELYAILGPYDKEVGGDTTDVSASSKSTSQSSTAPSGGGSDRELSEKDSKKSGKSPSPASKVNNSAPSGNVFFPLMIS